MKHILTSILICITFYAQAQQISNTTIVPAAPTTNDNIKVIVESWFPSGTCNLFQNAVSYNGNNINIDFTHCLGMLSVICNTTDTFNMGLLTAGTYTLNLNLFTGPIVGPSGCTGVLTNSATTTFNVTQIMAVPESQSGSLLILTDQNFLTTVLFPENTTELKISITELNGRLIKNALLNSANNTIDLNTCKPGIYLYEAISETGKLFRGKIQLR